MPVVALWAAMSPALWADWGQYRHDAAHTGCADETATPPLELRWKQIDCPDGQLNCTGKSGLHAYDGDLYLRRCTVGLVRLNGQTGEVVWQQAAFPDYVLAVDGGAVIVANQRVPPGNTFPLRWNGWIDAYDAETGVRAWRLEHPGDLPGFLVLCGDWARGRARPGPVYGPPTSCLVRGGMLCAHGLMLVERGKHAREYEACLTMASVAEGRVTGVSTCNPGRTEPLVAPGAILPQDPGFYEPEVAPYHDWFRLRAWGDRLMVLSHCEPRRSGEGLVAGPWAVLSDSVLSTTPEDYAADPWLVAEHWPTVVLAEKAGVVLGYTGPDMRTPARLTARHAPSGQFLWARPLVATPSNCPPAVDDGNAYLGLADGFVYGVSLQTGDVKWSTRVGAPVAEWAAEPKDGPDSRAPHCSVAGQTVWVVYARTLLALDATTGEIKWQTDKTQALLWEPVIDNGFVYLLTPFGVEAWGPQTQEEKTEPKEGELTGGSAAP